MPICARFLIAVCLLFTSTAASYAAEKRYVGLKGRCDVDRGVVTVSLQGSLTLFPFQGEADTRRYVACVDGRRGFGNAVAGFNGCRAFDIASYKITCFGGTVSAPQFFAAFADDMRSNKLRLSGNTLGAETQPSMMVVPFQNGAMERALRDSIRIVPLADGYAPFPRAATFRSVLWNDQLDIPQTSAAVLPAVPADFKTVPTPAWVQFLNNKIVFGVLLGVLIVYAAIAAFGFFPNDQQTRRSLSFFLLLLPLSGYMLYLACFHAIGTDSVDAANAELATARAQVAAYKSAGLTARSIVFGGGSELVPLTSENIKKIIELGKPPQILIPTDPSYSPALWAGLYLALPGLFLLLFSLRLAGGFYYLFRKPPIVAIAEAALRTEGRIDTDAAARALRPDLAAAHNPPPAYKSQSDAIHYTAVAEAIERQASDFRARAGDTTRKASLLDKLLWQSRTRKAVAKRELALRELEDAKRHVAELQRQLKNQGGDL